MPFCTVNRPNHGDLSEEGGGRDDEGVEGGNNKRLTVSVGFFFSGYAKGSGRGEGGE